MAPRVLVSASFDDVRAPDLRFLEEAARFGPVTALLWTDALVERHTGRPPKFPLAERRYFLEAVRYVAAVHPVDALADAQTLPAGFARAGDVWALRASATSAEAAAYCRSAGLSQGVIPEGSLRVFPPPPAPDPTLARRRKVIVTGCYDWFHSGHVRFFEEVSTYGDLYVVVGSDANVRALKGAGHPLLREDERRYVAGSIRHVTQALVASGTGWIDAEPEIARLRPDVYAVNEDGDKGGKREFCESHGIEYLVLKRVPAPGLPRRSSTHLRGF